MAPGPTPQPLTVNARAVLGDTSFVLTAGKELVDVPANAVFEVDLPTLADVRVRLFDEQGRAIPSTDRLQLGTPTHYRLAPTEPLASGSRHSLMIDGLKGDYPTDPAGLRYAIARLEFRTAGQKAPPADRAATKPANRSKKPKKSRR